MGAGLVQVKLWQKQVASGSAPESVLRVVQCAAAGVAGVLGEGYDTHIDTHTHTHTRLFLAERARGDREQTRERERARYDKKFATQLSQTAVAGRTAMLQHCHLRCKEAAAAVPSIHSNLQALEGLLGVLWVLDALLDHLSQVLRILLKQGPAAGRGRRLHSLAQDVASIHNGVTQMHTCRNSAKGHAVQLDQPWTQGVF